MLSKFRTRAMLLHLLFSAALMTGLALLALKIWFPYPLYAIDGTARALLIIFCVDLVVGPIITFVVSNNQKRMRELVFDFSVILLLQLSALGFGISEIYKQRVIALLHLDGSFHLVPSAAVLEQDVVPNLPKYQSLIYGSLEFADFYGLSDADAERLMYSPSRYKPLVAERVANTALPLAKVPAELVDQFGDSVIYKLIAGKQKNGVAVINDSMTLIHIDILE